MKPETYRLIESYRPVPLVRRGRAWLRGVLFAMRAKPKAREPIYVKIYPGDPRWDDPFTITSQRLPTVWVGPIIDKYPLPR